MLHQGSNEQDNPMFADALTDGIVKQFPMKFKK
jgi:hypothetical protein